MSLLKAIAAGKERRKPHRDSRAFDYSCRNHGSCPWCLGNRTRQARRQREQVRAEQREAV